MYLDSFEQMLCVVMSEIPCKQSIFNANSRNVSHLSVTNDHVQNND